MRYLGKVERITYSGLLVVRGADAPSIGDTVYTNSRRHVGVVKCVYGRVDSPYIIVKPARGEDILRVRGAELYVQANGDKDGDKRGRAKGAGDRKVSRMRKPSHSP